MTFSPSPLTFTTGNWSTAQTVTVQTAQDADALNDTATLSHAVSGADYGTVTAASVTVTVRDDETVSTVVVLTVDPTRLSESAGRPRSRSRRASTRRRATWRRCSA